MDFLECRGTHADVLTFLASSSDPLSTKLNMTKTAAEQSTPHQGLPLTEENGGLSHQGGNKTTARILRVLSAFLENPRAGYRVSELCKKLGIPKQPMIRALHTLVEEGYLCKKVDGAGYEIGYRIIELGSFDQVEPDLLEIAMPTMQRLHLLTGETVSLAVRVGDSMSVVDHIDGRWPQTGKVRKGRPMLLNIGPVSRTVLAFLSDHEIQDFIARHTPLPAMTSNAITDPVALWAEIRSTRQRGYGEGTVLPGVSAFGFPLFGADNRPHGSIGLLGLTEDIHGLHMRSTFGAILRLIEELNEQTRLFHANPGIEIGL